ncbi:hypothetical protein QCD70_13860 [Agreia sp. PsM10]|uniref:hypothetical protein n=1 Tax=Agreia sp. PsM10 TaxID=3030533 RepID=UPI00263B975E|nr:hypothetical protein [Agreia sp. PsM10]MDN4641338.1 hypothetical protein [Agreia sp. PsM10]
MIANLNIVPDSYGSFSVDEAALIDEDVLSNSDGRAPPDCCSIQDEGTAADLHIGVTE